MSFEEHPKIPRIPTRLVSLLGLVPCLKGQLVKIMVSGRQNPPRLNNPQTPLAFGMQYKDVDILAIDGIRLSAWLIPNSASKHLIVVNHPLYCTRFGSVKGFDGVPVVFMPMLKALHDAGYNILTYESRGQGESDGGMGKNCYGGREVPVGVGTEEWKDFQFSSKQPT